MLKQLGFGKKKQSTPKIPKPPSPRNDFTNNSTHPSQRPDMSTLRTQESQTLQRKIAFLEEENKQLTAEKTNLQETLAINKSVLNGILSQTMTNEEDILGSLQEESDMLIGEVQRVQTERDEFSAKVLMLEQINFEMSRKQIEDSNIKDNEQA